MRIFLRNLFFIITLAILSVPFSASAQAGVSLETVHIQLWPEFDQPNMLVIYDLRAAGMVLPQELKLTIPAEARVIAVAYEQDGGLFNIDYQETQVDSVWKQVALTLDKETTYHLEYYAPLTREDTQRDYTFLWSGDYALASLTMSIRVPVDTIEITTNPKMQETTPIDGQTYLLWETENLKAEQQVSIKLQYKKTSDRLSASNQPLETGQVDENTQGRISLNKYLPYILGGLGILLIVVGGVYFWQSSKGRSVTHKRHRSREESNGDAQIYCHQCGKRAQPGDRFCRTCGTRLRREQSK